MFGISFPELIFVFFIFLLVFGPDKLPEAARRFGKIMGMVKKNSDSLRREFYNAVYEPANEIQRTIKDSTSELRSVSSLLPDSEVDCEERARREEERQKQSNESETSPVDKPEAHD